jgi:glutamine amidotransferase-like uncharacterized protein
MKRELVILSVVFVMLISVASVSALQGADIAIYAGSGTWEPSKTAFKNFLEWKGLTWEEVNKNDINRKKLIGNYRGLFMPGGWAGDYNRDIKSAGDQHIRDFISQGGAYIGMSAGAFYACDVTIWQGDVLNYPSNIFDGDCIGPIDEIAPWPNYVMTTMDIDSSHPANIYEPAQRSTLYYGEPYFVPHQGQEMLTLASWIVPSNPVANGAPGIISFNYGQGRVVLVGPHPEIEEDDTRDGTDFASELSDGPDGSDWPFLWTAVDWMLKDPISLPPGTQTPQCSDGVDNDGDGLVDAADPGCVDAGDNDETDPAPPECNDGIDNDGDGLVDFPNDLGCDDANDDDETDPVPKQCEDGLDNDGDGLVDFPSDPGCLNAEDDDETDPTGPVEVFFDDFEDGDMSDWFLTEPGGGDPWLNRNSDPAFGSRHAFCKPRDTTQPASVMIAVASTENRDNIELSYYRKLKGLDAADHFEVAWSDGSGWNVVEHVSSTTDSSYKFKSYNLPASAANNPNFAVRFSCTAGAVSELCNVDNVKILGD